MMYVQTKDRYGNYISTDPDELPTGSDEIQFEYCTTIGTTCEGKEGCVCNDGEPNPNVAVEVKKNFVHSQNTPKTHCNTPNTYVEYDCNTLLDTATLVQHSYITLHLYDTTQVIYGRGPNGWNDLAGNKYYGWSPLSICVPFLSPLPLPLFLVLCVSL
jgi:hypothetical protein